MTCNGRSINDVFDVIRDDPSMLEIATKLHPYDQVHSTTRIYLGHFENKDLVGIFTLAKEYVPLNVRLIVEVFKLGDAIYDAKPLQVHKLSDFVSKTRESQFLAAIKKGI